MHRSLSRPATAVTLTAVLAVLPSTTTAAQATQGGSMAAAAAGAATGQRPSSRELLLLNGDRVLANRPPGSTMAPAGVLPATPGDQILSLVTGGQAYEIPAAALPYLGHGLQPDLFDLTALLRQETGGRLPVRLSYQGHRVPAVPGITITRAANGAAAGYLTASSAARFGAALDRQYRADHPRASYGTDGLFAGGLTISLGGSPVAARTTAPPAVRTAAAAPKRTLKVTATNLSGQPDTGDLVIVVNADNSEIYGSSPVQAVHVFRHGVATYHVPAGHYWAVGEFAPSGLMSVSRLVVLPQFSVTGNTAVHMAEQSATSQITMISPKPATAYGTNFWILRAGRSGPPTLVGWANGASPMWVTPTRRAPTVGTLSAYASQQLASPAGSGIPYRYVVDYRDPSGLIPRQQYLIRPGQLATVHEDYYQAGPGRGYVAFFGALPDSFAGYVEPAPFPLSLPGRLTAYLGGNMPAMTWSSYADVVSRTGAPYSGEENLFHPVPAGEQVTERWNSYPLHPAVNVNPDSRSFLTGLPPSASRAGNTLALFITPFGDNQPGHISFGVSPVAGGKVTGTYQIDQNGKKIAGGSTVPPGQSGTSWFTTQVKLAPHPSLVSFHLDEARTGPAFPLSTHTHTVWTWRSVPTPGTTLPGNWYCYITGQQEVRRCAVQPMMSLRYAVAGMSLAGQAPAGRQVVDLTVSHLPLVRPIPVRRAIMQVSFNGGKTWHQARVTGSHGHYRAVFDAPAGAYVMTRATAWDAAGGSVSETITRAYQIAP